jgi:asparaginyl-tRNA synthetase
MTFPTSYLPYTPPAGVMPVAASERSRQANVARVKAAMLRATQGTLDAEGFTQVVAPLLTGLSGACGEPGTLLSVDVRGKRAYLRQTSQLHLEPLMRELGRVYSIARSFRAERRASDRHLTEFTLIETEALGWHLPRLMDLMERMTVAMLHRAARTYPDALEALGVEVESLLAVQTPFKRMTYDEAILALQGAGHFVEWGEDLSNEHEVALAGMVGGPVFVTHYPVETRFFTMKVRRDDPRVVECCDLLMPGVGEVMGASETEPDAGLLETRMRQSRSVRQMEDLGLSAQDYDWYLDMHREVGTQQAGFGMGFERVVRYACGLESVRQAL